MVQALWAKRMGRGRGARSTPPSRCSANRWSLLVLRDIVFGGRRHFRKLQANSIEGIASNILADRLQRLVESGLLTREDTRPGQRAHYSLTEPAIQLVPVFAQLGSRGLRHRPSSSSLRIRAELLEQAAPRSGRSSWTSFAASTLAPNSRRGHRAFASA